MPTTRPKTTTTAKRSPRRRVTRPATPSHQAIAERAYALYEAQGGGDQLGHWLQAERELSGVVK